jgi:hypothetical protein
VLGINAREREGLAPSSAFAEILIHGLRPWKEKAGLFFLAFANKFQRDSTEVTSGAPALAAPYGLLARDIFLIKRAEVELALPREARDLSLAARGLIRGDRQVANKSHAIKPRTTIEPSLAARECSTCRQWPKRSGR